MLTDYFIVLDFNVEVMPFHYVCYPSAPSPYGGFPPVSGAVLNLPAMLHNGRTEPGMSVADAGCQLKFIAQAGSLQVEQFISVPHSQPGNTLEEKKMQKKTKRSSAMI